MRRLAMWVSLAWGCTLGSNSFAAEVPAGNNAEAESFARDLSNSTGTWRLELTPEKLTGRDAIQYRKSVSYAKATVTVDPKEWLGLSETMQRSMVKVWMDTLHKAPAIVTGELGYYPNSAGEITIVANGKAVASGKYSKQKSSIVLQPSTFSPDEPNKYSAEITVVLDRVGGSSFRGTTSIPDKILFTLSRGRLTAQASATVQNGSFSTGVFTDGGIPMPFGKYSLSLSATSPELLEAKGTIVVPDTRTLRVVFAPTKF